jgi:glucose/arabinose dehydrogenase
VAFAFAPDGRMFYTERTTGEVLTVQLSATTASPEQQHLPPVLAAKEDLAGRTQVDADEITVVSVTARQWPDSCLGAPSEGEICAQVITPGYEVVLRGPDSANEYRYHTDESTAFRLAGAQPAPSEGQVFATIEVHSGDECGLLGIAIDPEFEQNHYVYAYAVRPVPGLENVGRPAVLRYTDVDGQGTEPLLLMELPETNPQTCAHVAGNLHFGPDGYLYVSVGNLEQPELGAGLSAPVGKILRLNKSDGSAAPDNPFVAQAGAEARTFAYGFRNPFDFAFAPDGSMYAPDNGPGNCDELNLVEAGRDYGAPGSLPSDEVDSCLGLGGTDPIYLFAAEGTEPGEFSNVAPAGVAYTTGDRYPDIGAGLLVCQFNTGELRILELAPDGRSVTDNRVVNNDCQFNVEVGPDGLIYYSNRDGIFRIPANAP